MLPLGLLSNALYRRYQTYKYDLVICIYGLLAGLVAITSPAALVDTYIAVVIGCIFLLWLTESQDTSGAGRKTSEKEDERYEEERKGEGA